MEPIDRHIRRRGFFLRRRDLLSRGYSDQQIATALGRHDIFRVRQGWYSVPDAPEEAVLAVRVGGRLTGISALQSYGLRVPRRDRLHIAVPIDACRLRRPQDRRRPLEADDRVRVHWVERPAPRASNWRVPIADALLVVLLEESRDIAVACCSAVMRYKFWTDAEMDAVFAAAPARVRRWRSLVCRLDDSHGETFVRLWLGDVGIPYESQPFIQGVGWLDGRVAPHTYVEVDGGQHDPLWTGDSPSSFEHDHQRDTAMAERGDRVLRCTYLQLYRQWASVLAAIRRAISDDLALSAYRQRHPLAVAHPAPSPRALSPKTKEKPVREAS